MVARSPAVTMEVRLSISSTTGLRVAPIPPQRKGPEPAEPDVAGEPA